MSKSFVISVLKDDYKVCRMNAFEGIPDWVLNTPLSSITRTAEEFSIVCPNSVAPDELKSNLPELSNIKDSNYFKVVSGNHIRRETLNEPKYTHTIDKH